MKPAVLTALLTFLLTTGGAVFTFGERLGRAESEARFWYQYSEGLMKRPECR